VCVCVLRHVVRGGGEEEEEHSGCIVPCCLCTVYIQNDAFKDFVMRNKITTCSTQATPLSLCVCLFVCVCVCVCVCVIFNNQV